MEPKFNKFVTFSFSSPEEERVSKSFHPLNLAFIQNTRAECAEKKLATVFDPLNPMAFGLEQAEMTGQINILDWIIAEANRANPPTIDQQSEQES